jgi:FkbM family methyltransferase
LTQVRTTGPQQGGDARLSVHHIGGRGGSRSFPILERFEQDIVSVLYDADSACLTQARQANEGLASELNVLAHCFAGSSGERTFYINYDPYSSSMLAPNPDFASWYYNNGAHDYSWGELTRPMEERRVRTVTLDEVFAAPGASPPTPDVLSIDTQGSELEILQGGTAILHDSIVAIVCEVEFVPLYRGQPLFGDVAAHLRERGFHFARFAGLYELSPVRRGIGLRAGGFQSYAEAIFLKDVEALPADAVARTRKLAFVSIVFGCLEYGLASLDRSGPGPGDLAYERFLGELKSAARARRERLPRSFSEAYSFEQSVARSDPSSQSRPLRELIRNTSLERPARVLLKVGRRMDRWRAHGHRRTEVERVLASWGLEETAVRVRERRLAEEPLIR